MALPFRKILVIVLFFAGLLVGMLDVNEFRKSNTTVDPRLPGKTRTLVTAGIYRITRNPIYLGLLLILLAWACYLDNILPFLLLPVFVLYMNRFQIAPKERIMHEKFADGFTDYRRQVRRWI